MTAGLTVGGSGLSEHDAAWAVAERAVDEINRHIRVGKGVWLGPRVEHRFPDRWLAWIERDPHVAGVPFTVHIFGPTEAQALRQLAWDLAEHPPE